MTENDIPNAISQCCQLSPASPNAPANGLTANRIFTAMPASTVKSRILLERSPHLNSDCRSERILNEWKSSKNESVRKVSAVAISLPQRLSAAM